MTTLTFLNPDIRLGFHLGLVNGSLFQTFEAQTSTELRSYQISIGSDPNFAISDLQQARRIIERNGKYLCIHANLHYNLAGSVEHRRDPKFTQKIEYTCGCFAKELDVGVMLGSGAVVHVGACSDRKRGLFTVSKAIESALRRKTPLTKQYAKTLGIPEDEFLGRRKIILENSSGSINGNKLGDSLEEFVEIYDKIDHELKPQVKICIDTAHLFASGEADLGHRRCIDRFFKDFDEKLGLDKLELFHLNDSRVAFDTKKDRHENFGSGYLFGGEDRLECLEYLISRAERLRIPLIGEPPGDDVDKNPVDVMFNYDVVREICPALEETHHVC